MKYIMPPGLPLLLRLPPCLRQQLISREPLVKSLLQQRPCFRPFHSQTRLAAENQRPPPKPRVLKPEAPPAATRPTSKPAAPRPAAPRPAASRPPPPRNPHEAVPAKPQARYVPPPVARQAERPTTSYSSLEEAIVTKYAEDAPTILLYVAPSHRTFKFLSVQIGIVFTLGAYLIAQEYLKDDPEKGHYKPWHLKTVGGLNALFLAVAACVLFLGPSKLIQSVSVIKAASLGPSVNAGRLLRIEIKRMMPFAKPDVVEVPSTNIMIDREVRAGSQQIPQINIPPANAVAFTKAYASGTLGKGGKMSIAATLFALNQSRLDAFSTLKREVGRMFRRDNIAYIDIKGSGKFKLDLRDCYILDHGQPLAQFFRNVDPLARGTVWSRMTTLFKK